MRKLKTILATILSAFLVMLSIVVGGKVVKAEPVNTTYTLDAKVGSIGAVIQSTADYFTVSKNGGTASIGGGNCTATFTSIIDGNQYTAVKASSTVTGIQGIKMESATTITFTTTVNSTSTVTVLWGNNSSGKNGTTIKFDGTASTNSVDGLTATTTQTWENVEAGSHTISAGTNQATIFEIVVVESIEMEAGTYSVTYNKNGHGEQPDPAQGVTSLPDPLPTLSETGYTFGGWYTDSELKTPAVAGAEITANITLYAKWTVNSSEWCTITFDANGGSAVASTSQIYGSIYTLPNCTKSGYYLTGWSDGSNTYAGTYTIPSQSTVTLTAQWEETISFDEECYFSKADSNNTAAASNSMFTVSGKVYTNADGAVSFNGNTYNTPLKMESATTLSFILTKSATIYIAFTADSGNCKIQGGTYSSATKVTATNGVLVLELTADSYTITKGDTNNIGFVGIIYKTTADFATATLESQVNGNGDSIRFVTTLTGVELTDITSWNVTFTLTGVDNPVTTASFTTLYLAVAGNNGKDAEDGTFYLVYTITEIPTTANGKVLSATMTITFADGSTKTTNASANTIAVTATE